MTSARGDGTGLKLSLDRKVSPRGIWQHPQYVAGRPGRWIAKIPNSFGLPSHWSCPGATSFCASCYGTNSEKSKGVAGLLAHNLELLLRAEQHGGTDAMAGLLAEMLGRYHRHATRARLTEAERIFRIHWDGDFFNAAYARAWATACAEFPDIRFWCYTRSFAPELGVIEVLPGIPNLTTYLSVDADNIEQAVPALELHPRLRAAWCAATHGEAARLADHVPDPRPLLACPENTGRVPLMDAGVGACVSCSVCPQGRRDITFATSGGAAPARPSKPSRVGVGSAP